VDTVGLSLADFLDLLVNEVLGRETAGLHASGSSAMKFLMPWWNLRLLQYDLQDEWEKA